MGDKKKIYPQKTNVVLNEKEKREALVKGYRGQLRYLNKRIAKDTRKILSKGKKKSRLNEELEKDIRACEYKILKWKERIDACRSGAPLDFLGKSL